MYQSVVYYYNIIIYQCVHIDFAKIIPIKAENKST